MDSRRGRATSPGPGACGVPPEAARPLPAHPLSTACWIQLRWGTRPSRSTSVNEHGVFGGQLALRAGTALRSRARRLDEAVLEGTTQFNTRRVLDVAAQRSTRRRLGEQLGNVRLGGAPQRVRRWASALEGALSHSALESSSGESSIWLSGPSSLGRIGVCREEPLTGAATLRSQPSLRRDARRSCP